VNGEHTLEQERHRPHRALSPTIAHEPFVLPACRFFF
jgi:hypothetical protein